MKKFEILILTAILLVGFVLRLYRFDSPIADWHSWRQADTSSVSRIFVNEGFDILHPKFHDISNVQTDGKYQNPQGFRFVEFPIYNVFQAGGFLLFDKFTLEQWGRLVSIFSSVAAALLIFLILKKHLNTAVGLWGAFFYSVLPFNIFWGRTVLPDSLAITATLGGIYFFNLYIGLRSGLKRLSLFILSVIFLSAALLLKPFTIFFFLPIFALSFQKWKWDFLKKKDLWFMALLALFPFLIWRIWMLQFPEGIPVSGWLFNEGNIRFSGAFFHWIFANRIGELILGLWGLPLLVLGILVKVKNKLFLLSFLFSSLLYLVIVAAGNVRHSYYQILIVPSIVIFLAIGSNFLLKPPAQFFSRKLTISLLFICIVFSLAFSWKEVRDYFNINNPSIVLTGEAVRRLTPEDSLIIAPYEGDTAFLYQTDRRGWASFTEPIEGLIKRGADYLVLVNPKEKDYDFGKKYKIIEATDHYIIFNLNTK